MKGECPSSVLLLIFNRPEYAQKVFEEIRKARPARLYIAADGPRKHVPTDARQCRKAREVVDSVDWPCEVRTLLRDENLGCKRAVSSALDWFFENEEEGIILEDDCVPSQDFFRFCQQLLRRYRGEPRVKAISGTSVLADAFPSSESYVFSRYFSVWGWATWKRAWQEYDLAMSDWPKLRESGWLQDLFPLPYVRRHMKRMFDLVYEGRIDTWDVQFVYSCLRNDGLAIVPAVNLISNIGVEGTHTAPGDTKRNFLPVGSLDTERMKHPLQVRAHTVHDNLLFERLFKISVGEKIRKTLLRILARLKRMLSGRQSNVFHAV
jgi:hypothetical protein